MAGKGKSSKNTKSDIFYALKLFYDTILSSKRDGKISEGDFNNLEGLYTDIKNFLEFGSYSKASDSHEIAALKNLGRKNTEVAEYLGLKGTCLRIKITRLTAKAYDVLFNSDDFPKELLEPWKLSHFEIQNYRKRISVASLRYYYNEEIVPYINLLVKERIKGKGVSEDSPNVLLATTQAEIVLTLAMYSNTAIRRALSNFNSADLKTVFKDLNSGERNEASCLYSAFLADSIDISPRLTQELADYAKTFDENVIYESKSKVDMKENSKQLNLQDTDIESQQIIASLQAEIEELKAQLKSNSSIQEASRGSDSSQEVIDALNTQIENLQFQLNNTANERDSLFRTIDKKNAELEALKKRDNSSSFDSDEISGYKRLQELFGTDITRELLKAKNTNTKLTSKTSERDDLLIEQDKVLFFLANYSKEVFYEKLKLLDSTSLAKILNALESSSSDKLTNAFKTTVSKVIAGKKVELPDDISNSIHSNRAKR